LGKPIVRTKLGRVLASVKTAVLVPKLIEAILSQV
jgi:hypothetical protein